MKIYKYLPTTALVCCVLLVITAGTLGFGAQFEPGKARWKIKTSVPEGANVEGGRKVSYEDLVKLEDSPGVKRNDKRYREELIPVFENSLKVKEGDILTTQGWFHLVAAESDGDYHIQISGAQDSQASCLIVEVPMPESEFVSSEALRSVSKKVRDFIKEKLLKGKEPSKNGSVMVNPVYVEIAGQLFYDDAHVGDKPRGKKGCKAATLWELHPVTAIHFVPEP